MPPEMKDPSGSTEILFVLNTCSLGVDGPSTGGNLTVNSLIQHLSEDHHISVVCGGPTRPRPGGVLESVHWLGPSKPPRFGLATYVVTYHRFRRRVREIIEAEEPELVITQGTIAPAAIREADRAGIRSIAVVRGYGNLSLYCPVDGNLPTLVDRKTPTPQRYLKLARDFALSPLVLWYLRENRWALRAADQVVTNSEYMAARIYDAVGVRPEVIHPHVSCEVPDQGGSGVGFVCPQVQKGSETVLRLAERTPEIDYRFFGNPDQATASFQAPENVTYEGWVENPADIYAEVELVIVPSRWPEPFGRVAAEALQAGIPCIVSDIGGLPEVVGDAGARVEDYEDPEAWRSEVTRIIEDPQLKRRMAKEGRHRGWDRFSPEAILPAWSRVIETHIGTRDSPGTNNSERA